MQALIQALEEIQVNFLLANNMGSIDDFVSEREKEVDSFLKISAENLEKWNTRLGYGDDVLDALKVLNREIFHNSNPKLDIRKFMDSMKSAHHEAFSKVGHKYSRFEDPSTISIIEAIQSSAENALSQFLDNIVRSIGGPQATVHTENVVFGTVLWPEFNAHAVDVNDANGFLIIFNSRLMKWFHRMSLFYFKMRALVPIREFYEINLTEEGWERKYVELVCGTLLENDQILEDFANTLLDVVFGEDGSIDLDYYGMECRVQAGLMTESAELFIFGHEYGHISLGHLRDETKRVSRLRIFQGEIFTLQQVLELEADLFGFYLTHAYLNQKIERIAENADPILMSGLLEAQDMGPSLFFSITETQKEAMKLLGLPVKEDSSSHPESADRLFVHKTFLEQMRTDKLRASVQQQMLRLGFKTMTHLAVAKINTLGRN